MATMAQKKSFVQFSDVSCESLSLESTWSKKTGKTTKDFNCQTDADLFELCDTGTQTGLATDVLESQVTNKNHVGLTLIEYLKVVYSNSGIYRGQDIGTAIALLIEAGYVMTNENVCREKSRTLQAKTAVTLTLVRCNVETQTSEVGKVTDANEDGLAKFLGKVASRMEEELNNNCNSKAFEGYDAIVTTSSEDVKHWNTLTVDLQKRGVLYPDWATAKKAQGRISKCKIKSNKERIYDVEYLDGAKLYGVREEFIDILYDTATGQNAAGGLGPKPDSSRRSSNAVGGGNLKLFDGLRVHVKKKSSRSSRELASLPASVVYYIPGRVVKTKSGGFDVECDEDVIVKNVSVEDVLFGIEEQQLVMARRPEISKLQCTGVSWNASNTVLAAVYGRRDISGWCDSPGAVCTWSIFDKAFNPSEPDHVLDAPSCGMCIHCHPENPSLIAGGFFNGEVIVWDISKREATRAITEITEYSHREPVMALKWILDRNNSWLIASTSVDGKVLLWKPTEDSTPIRFPCKGFLLTNSKMMKSHGCTSIAIASNSAKTSTIILGQEGGTLLKTNHAQLFHGGLLTQEAFKSNPPEEKLFPSLLDKSDSSRVKYDRHDGAVNSVDFSPFQSERFLSGGADGTIKLFNLKKTEALLKWEPSPTPGTIGVSEIFCPITAVRFSPNRPCVFAASSLDGFVYIYDFSESLNIPVHVLEASMNLDQQQKSTAAVGRAKRSGVTGIAFNKKYKFLAASDLSGRVHIWRLTSKLSTEQSNDASVINQINSTPLNDY